MLVCSGSQCFRFFLRSVHYAAQFRMDFCSPLCFGKILRCRWSLGFRDNVGFKKVICHPEQKNKSSFIIIIIDRFYVALFSAFKPTHCARNACGSEWVTGAFSTARLLKISTEHCPNLVMQHTFCVCNQTSLTHYLPTQNSNTTSHGESRLKREG